MSVCVRFLVFLLISIAFGAAAAPAEETSYNKGVAAWREKNYAQARKHWEQSLAEGGPDEALNNLAFLLYNGMGGDKQRSRAVELWRKGAALSVSEAQLHLAQAYESGGGIDMNLAAAYGWYRCAIATASDLSSNDPTETEIKNEAIAAVGKLTPKLSSAERDKGEALAASWISRYSHRLSAKP